jgi:tetratricopeptide (TPR) repeat protein
MRHLLLGVGILLTMAGAVVADSLLDSATEDERAILAVVRQAATAALLHDLSSLDDAVRAAETLDDTRDEDGRAPTGLTDDVRLMSAALRPTRAARRDALEAVLDADPDPEVERVATYTREYEDDMAAADDLLADDRHNRRATLLNDAVRPFGVFSGTALLAAVNPFLLAGSAVDSLVTTAVNLYHYGDLSPREREALVRYRRQLARDPDPTHRTDVPTMVNEIAARRNATQCADTTRDADRALDVGDLDRARFFVRTAETLPRCADRVAPLAERLRTASVAHERASEDGRWPANDLRHPPPDERDAYRAVAVATVLGDDRGMQDAARGFADRFPESRHRNAALLTAAIGEDLAGRHEDAEDTLREIAGDADGAARAAQAILGSARFDRLGDLDDAESRHAREVARYVLIGGGPDGRTALYTAAQLGAQGVSAAQSFGIFNVIGMMSRAWSAWRKDPASNQAIIDEGERLLATEPDPREASDVHERLATAYERAGTFDRALLHYRAVTNPDPARIVALEEKIAEQLLENASKAGGEPALLAAIVQYYPSTEAGEKAQAALAAMPRPSELPLSREVLVGHPGLLGPTALDLDAALLDGRVGNGELAEAGVVVGLDAITLHLEDPTGGIPRPERRTLDPEAARRARAAAEGALYSNVLTTDPNADERGRFERFIPIYLTGSIGDSGVSVAPGIKLRPNRSADQALYE